MAFMYITVSSLWILRGFSSAHFRKLANSKSRRAMEISASVSSALSEQVWLLPSSHEKPKKKESGRACNKVKGHLGFLGHGVFIFKRCTQSKWEKRVGNVCFWSNYWLQKSYTRQKWDYILFTILGQVSNTFTFNFLFSQHETYSS